MIANKRQEIACAWVARCEIGWIRLGVRSIGVIAERLHHKQTINLIVILYTALCIEIATHFLASKIGGLFIAKENESDSFAELFFCG